MTAIDYARVSTEDLIRQFAEKAKIAGMIWAPSSWEKLRRTPERQALVSELQAIGAELRARKPILQIRQLFKDQDPDVRGWAAPQFIEVDPEWGNATFAGLSEKPNDQRGLEALSARARNFAGSSSGLRRHADRDIDRAL
jgi:hypothetical protein